MSLFILSSNAYDSFSSYFFPNHTKSDAISVDSQKIIAEDQNKLDAEWKKKIFDSCEELRDTCSDLFIEKMSDYYQKADLVQLQKRFGISNVYKYVLKNEKEVSLCISGSTQQATTANKIRHFFGNFIEYLVDFVHFFDGKEPPSSIYEKNAGIQIYFQFFKIPFAIAVILQPFILVTWQVYAATVAILASATAGICIYMKHFRMFPKALPYCDNLDEIGPQEYPHPIHGLDREIKLLIKRLVLNKARPIMLRAKAGQGKTTLVYKLHQMIKQGRVPKELKDKKIFLIDAKMIAKSAMGISDKLKMIKAKLAGFEQEIIIFIDEIHAFTENPANMELIKGFLRHSKIRFITATTSIQYEEIKLKDKDGSFCSRFKHIKLKKRTDQQIKSLLKKSYKYETKKFVLKDKAVETIVKLTNDCLPKQAQPLKAMKLLDEVLEEKKFSWRKKKISTENHQFIKKLKEIRTQFKKQLKDDVDVLKSLQGRKDDLQLEKRYLFSKFYIIPTLNKKINKVLAKFDRTINAEFVKKVFPEYLSSEK